jgi:hypothetical protein
VVFFVCKCDKVRKLQNEAHRHFFDNVIKAVCEERQDSANS